VLVEKHVEGDDYRVHVYKDEAFWVSHRVPGSVTGDGAHTVAQLLEQLNADPRRGERGSKAPLKRIHLDEEATDLLIEQGLTPESVPPEGLFVRLRRAANVASGGVPTPVLHEAHPDNLALAVRATRVMGLDLAGVDLLMPDIKRSWLETGAAICEINSQPQYNPGVHAVILQRLVQGNGRIPVVIVLGDADGSCAQIADGLASFGCPGSATSTEVRVGGTVVRKGPGSAYEAGIALLGDPLVDVAVIGISDMTVVGTGMPVDSFDVLVLASPMKAADGAADWQRWRSFASVLASMCTGSVIVNQDCAGWTSAEAASHPERLVRARNDQLPDAACRSGTCRWTGMRPR
jgi:cyanophycin synthetase